MLGGALLSVGCPGQRRPAPRAAAPTPDASAAPSAAASPTPAATPQTLPEQVQAWRAEAEALLKEAEALSPQDLPRLESLTDRGGLLGDRAIEAEQDELYDALEELLSRLGELRIRLVEASPEAGR